MRNNATVKGDRALQKGDDDKLGFRGIAARIGTALIDHASDGGLVVGLEGKWGSGKSSLLFLIQEELVKLPEHLRPTIINFRPWLVGDRDALLANLLASLITGVDQVAFSDGGSSGLSPVKAKAVAESLRAFTMSVCKAGDAVELIGSAVGFAPVGLAGKFLNSIGKRLKDKPPEPSLEELKHKLVGSLAELGHRFIVTIDDVDRLDPKEAIEVLRLTRSVADFPNVVYLLCYDSAVLEQSIQKVAKVDSGRAYLEKLVQLTIMVPTPEPFQLRQWFSEELHKIAATKSDDESFRLQTIIDYEGGRQLKSPRSVIRALDSIRFFWPPLSQAKCDLSDLVWLQLIKDGNPGLFRWIEDYCGLAAVLSFGTARVENPDRNQKLSDLNQLVEDGCFEDHIYAHAFSGQLAGVEVEFAEEGENCFKLYQQVDEETRNAAIKGGRLSSPDHYRLYFALAGPTHALLQEDFDSVWGAADTGEMEVGAQILKWHNENHIGSLSKADIFLERLLSATEDALQPKRCESLLVAFSNVMDDAYRVRPFDIDWGTSLWGRGQKLVSVLLEKVGVESRLLLVDRIFRDGNAIGWLTKIFRREFFAHGRYGSNRRPQESWFFTDPELDRITTIMLSRFRAMTASEVFIVISPLDVLFAWGQGGDEDGPKHLVEASIETDEGLVATLEGLTSTIRSSDRGEFQVLKQANLIPFLDFDGARARIKELESGEIWADRARALSKAFEDGEEY